MQPSDPPWPLLGLPRIITNVDSLCRLLHIVERPANGLKLFTGSLGIIDIPDLVWEFSVAQGIHFTHCRNVRRSGSCDFREVSHPARFGVVNMRKVMKALSNTEFTGVMRSES